MYASHTKSLTINRNGPVLDCSRRLSSCFWSGAVKTQTPIHGFVVDLFIYLFIIYLLLWINKSRQTCDATHPQHIHNNLLAVMDLLWICCGFVVDLLWICCTTNKWTADL